MRTHSTVGDRIASHFNTTVASCIIYSVVFAGCAFWFCGTGMESRLQTVLCWRLAVVWWSPLVRTPCSGHLLPSSVDAALTVVAAGRCSKDSELRGRGALS
jgi:hypothetical protein